MHEKIDSGAPVCGRIEAFYGQEIGSSSLLHLGSSLKISCSGLTIVNSGIFINGISQKKIFANDINDIIGAVGPGRRFIAHSLMYTASGTNLLILEYSK